MVDQKCNHQSDVNESMFKWVFCLTSYESEFENLKFILKNGGSNILILPSLAVLSSNLLIMFDSYYFDPPY